MIYTYPADGQQHVPPGWDGGESPDPLPTVNTPVGYPVSLYIAHPSTAHAAVRPSANYPWRLTSPTREPTQWRVTTAELRDSGEQLVDTYLLHKDTDPNENSPDVVFLIAHTPMATNETYTAHITGTDSKGAAFDHTWSFTTEVAAAISDIGVQQITAGGATVVWHTAGTATGYVEYGTDTTYGSQAQGQTQNGTLHWASLSGLQPETLYHYRAVAQAEGETRMSDDRTFMTTAPDVLEVPSEYATIAEAITAAQAGDTIQIAAGTYPESGLSLWRAVKLVGDGWQDTIIDAGGTGPVLQLSPGSTVEGVTLKGSGSEYFDAGLYVVNGAAQTGTVTLRNSRITGNNSKGVMAYCYSNISACAMTVILEHNVIDHNATDGVNSDERVIVQARNNTIIDNDETGLVFNNASDLAENNIIVGNATGLNNSANATTHYNDVWDNTTNYSGGTAGTGSLAMDPMFRARTGSDYRLHAGSPAVGHGTPAGTDMGALPFTSVGDTPTGVNASPTGADEWTISWTGTGATGYYVYVGSEAGIYSQRFDAGTETQYVLNVQQLAVRSVTQSDYVAVSSYDAQGDESAVSSAIILTAAGENHAPYAPGNPSPNDSETDVALTPTLTWTGGDPDTGDSVTYTVAFDTSATPTKVTTTTQASYMPPTLITDTQYYWQITASDGVSSTVGPVWSFTTTAAPGQMQPYHTLTINKVGNGTVIASVGSATFAAPGQRDYISGTVVTLTPYPDTGWVFAGWSDDLSGTASPAQVTMNTDKNITATFTPEGYKVYLPLVLRNTGSIHR